MSDGEDLEQDESVSDQNDLYNSGSDHEDQNKSGSEDNEDEQGFVNSLKSLISKEGVKTKTEKNEGTKKVIKNLKGNSESADSDKEENSEENNFDIEEEENSG